MDKIPSKQIIVAVFLTVLLVGTGTLGYVVLEGARPIEALYMVVVTISTVGFGEVVPVTNDASRLFTMVLIIVGIGFFFWLVTEFARITIGKQLAMFARRDPMLKEIRELKNHYIICGYGRMGRAICDSLLESGVKLVVIEQNPQLVETSGTQVYPHIIGDAEDEVVLQEAHIESARGIVAATGSDATNVYITMTAHELRPDLFIVARADSEKAEPKLRTAGAQRIISPYKLSANQAMHTLLRPAVVNFMDLAIRDLGQTMQIEQIEISKDSPFVDSTFMECGVRDNFKATIIGVEKHDGEISFNPSAAYKMEAGDVLIVFSDRDNLDKFAAAAGKALKPDVLGGSI